MLRMITAIAAVFAIAGAAAAEDAKSIVDAAKAECEVGETLSGYLEEVDSDAAPAVVAAMKEINIKRRALYAQLAARQNVTLDVVAQLTGKRQVENAAAGECVKDADGIWKTK